MGLPYEFSVVPADESGRNFRFTLKDYWSVQLDVTVKPFHDRFKVTVHALTHGDGENDLFIDEHVMAGPDPLSVATLAIGFACSKLDLAREAI